MSVDLVAGDEAKTRAAEMNLRHLPAWRERLKVFKRRLNSPVEKPYEQEFEAEHWLDVEACSGALNVGGNPAHGPYSRPSYSSERMRDEWLIKSPRLLPSSVVPGLGRLVELRMCELAFGEPPERGQGQGLFSNYPRFVWQGRCADCRRAVTTETNILVRFHTKARCPNRACLPEMQARAATRAALKRLFASTSTSREMGGSAS